MQEKYRRVATPYNPRPSNQPYKDSMKKIVVIGGGFAGVNIAREIGRKPA